MVWTEDQFNFMAGILRANGASKDGVYLVLVMGLRACEASRQTGMCPNKISASLGIYRRTRAEFARLFPGEMVTGM